MKCENSFCIYQSKGKCTLDKVDIDSLGMCAECIYPDIDEKILNQAKLELLKITKKQTIIKHLVFALIIGQGIPQKQSGYNGY